MEFFAKRSNAAIIAAALIIFSLFAGSWRSVAAEKAKALDMFRNGQSAFALWDDLQYKAGLAANVITTYQKYSADAGAVKALDSAIQDLKASENSPKKAYAASERVTAGVKALAEKIESLPLTGDDRTRHLANIDNFNGNDARIANSGYNAAASGINRKINSFPTVVFKNIMLIKNAELFGK